MITPGEVDPRKQMRRLGLPPFRHDEDNKIPRTTDEIYSLNRAVANKMEKIFLNNGIPVIPSIGSSAFLWLLRYILMTRC